MMNKTEDLELETLSTEILAPGRRKKRNDNDNESLSNDKLSKHKIDNPTVDINSNSKSEYSPRPYLFKLNDFEHLKDIILDPKYLNNAQVKCPDFKTLLDHTIAIVWSIYSVKKEWKKLHISQIEWALRLMENIRNETGEHPADIELVINHCTEMIFNIYSIQNDLSNSNSNVLTNGFNENNSSCPLSMTLEDMLSKDPEKYDLLTRSNK